MGEKTGEIMAGVCGKAGFRPKVEQNSRKLMQPVQETHLLHPIPEMNWDMSSWD